LRVLAEYGGPSGLAAEVPAVAAAKLRRYGGVYLQAEKIAGLVASAGQTLGVRPTVWDRRRMADYAEEALTARRRLREAARRLAALTRTHAGIQALAPVVVLNTACVLWVGGGDPGAYSCGAAYAKALGLNLAERSSGTQKGKLRITKRGKAMCRRWLYFAALRWAHHPRVRGWYERKKARDGQGAKRALVGVMRKLTRALYQVGGRGATFDPRRLFPGGGGSGAGLVRVPVLAGKGGTMAQ